MSKILLTGSSIFEQWSNASEAAPDHIVVNRAIGGTVTPYWKDVLGPVLAAEKPDVLWMYCGSNDLCAETVPDDVADNIGACRKIATEKNPAMRFAYFSIIKAPQKKGRLEVIDAIHADIRARLLPGDLFVDLNQIFFPNGAPVRELFVEDELHLTAAAYDAMVEFTRPLMHKWLNG
jgi:lysophospholipase L1-like esterase